MSKPNSPYNPNPEREDAFSELAKSGFEAVRGDHSARLARMQAKLNANTLGDQAVERRLKQKRVSRWMAVAAGLAIFVVAGFLLTQYNSEAPDQLARAGQDELNEAVHESAPPTQGDPIPEQSASTQHNTDLEPGGAALKESQPKQSAKSQAERVSRSAQHPVQKRAARPEPAEVVKKAERTVIADESLQRKLKRLKTETAAESEENADYMATSTPLAKQDAAPAIEETNTTERPSAPLGASTVAETSEISSNEEVKADQTFVMSRLDDTSLRLVSGVVNDLNGYPLPDAVVTVLETGHQVHTNRYGKFSFMLPKEAVIATVTAENYESVQFDLTKGDEFEIGIPRGVGALPSLSLAGKSTQLSLVAPLAERNERFEAFLKNRLRGKSTEEVVVQFDINRLGRPKRIVPGPGNQDEKLVKAARLLLLEGPDWDEHYRKESWRYTLRVAQ